MKKLKKTKRVAAGKPLRATDEELNELDIVAAEDMQRMIDKWHESAPPKARGYIDATIQEPIDAEPEPEA